MDLRKIKKLIELLEESALDEIEISEGEESIRLSRNTRVPSIGRNTSISSVAEIPQSPAPPQDKNQKIQDGIPVVSPMVGTFYASPDPESTPYVKTGSEVMAGDTLCVIEAMKIFNHVEAEQAGVIREIFKNSGDPVEYGETLFLMEPPRKENTV